VLRSNSGANDGASRHQIGANDMLTRCYFTVKRTTRCCFFLYFFFILLSYTHPSFLLQQISHNTMVSSPVSKPKFPLHTETPSREISKLLSETDNKDIHFTLTYFALASVGSTSRELLEYAGANHTKQIASVSFSMDAALLSTSILYFDYVPILYFSDSTGNTSAGRIRTGRKEKCLLVSPACLS
jgi:hypothetical protein